MIMSPSLRKKINFFYSVNVIVGMIAAINASVLTVFLLNKGLTFTQIGIIYSAFLITSLVCEYPSGVLADRFGRKRIFCIGILFSAFVFGIYANTRVFPLLVIAGMFGGAGEAFMSCAFESWLTGECQKSNTAIDFNRIFGMNTGLEKGCSIIVVLLFAFLLKENLGARAVYNALFIGMTALSLVVWSLYGDNKAATRHNYQWFFIGILHIFLKHKQLWMITFIQCATFAGLAIFILFWQPQALALSLRQSHLPLIQALFLSCVAAGGFVYSRYPAHFRMNNTLIYQALMMMAGFILFSIRHSVIAYLSGVIFIGCMIGINKPFFFAYSAEIIEPAHHASVLSLMSMISTLTTMMTNVCAGLFIERNGLYGGSHLGLLISLSAVVLIVIIRILQNSLFLKKIRTRIRTIVN